jgi:hypothetical protein
VTVNYPLQIQVRDCQFKKLGQSGRHKGRENESYLELAEVGLGIGLDSVETEIVAVRCFDRLGFQRASWEKREHLPGKAIGFSLGFPEFKVPKGAGTGRRPK